MAVKRGGTHHKLLNCKAPTLLSLWWEHTFTSKSSMLSYLCAKASLLLPIRESDDDWAAPVRTTRVLLMLAENSTAETGWPDGVRTKASNPF